MFAREVEKVRQMYRDQLKNAQTLLAETNRNKEQFEVECNKNRTEADNAMSKLTKKAVDLVVDLSSDEKKTTDLQNQVWELEKILNRALSDKLTSENEAKELRIENERLHKQLTNLQNQLEGKTVACADLEPQIQNLKAEFNPFQQQLTQNHKTHEAQTKTNREEIKLSLVEAWGVGSTNREERRRMKKMKSRMNRTKKRKEERERERERKRRMRMRENGKHSSDEQ